MKKKRVYLSLALILVALVCMAAGNPFILQLLNGSSILGTFTNYGQLKCSTGMSCSLSGSTFTMTSTGSGGTVTAGDGTVENTSPSAGALTLANAGAGTLLNNGTATAAAPTYTAQPTLGAVGGVSGQITYLGSTSGSGTFGCSSATCTTLSTALQIVSTAGSQFKTYSTSNNCAINSASPAACGSAASGAVVIPTTTTTYTINTTSVTAASRIQITWLSFASNLPSAPTCVAPATTTMPTVSAVVAATSFTITLGSTTGQTCPMYEIFN